MRTNINKNIKCIIVSGPDNCGKDTFCEQLKPTIENNFDEYVVYLCPKYLKACNDWSNDQKGLKRFVETIINSDNSEIILLNRSWFDEYIYGPLYRGYSDEDCKWLFELSKKFINHTVHIYLTDSPEVLAEREDGKSFSSGKVDSINNELARFEKLYNKLVQLGIKSYKCISSDYSKECLINAAYPLLNDINISTKNNMPSTLPTDSRFESRSWLKQKEHENQFKNNQSKAKNEK